MSCPKTAAAFFLGRNPVVHPTGVMFRSLIMILNISKKPLSMSDWETELNIFSVLFCSPLVMDNFHFWRNHSELMRCKLRNLLLQYSSERRRGGRENGRLCWQWWSCYYAFVMLVCNPEWVIIWMYAISLACPDCTAVLKVFMHILINHLSLILGEMCTICHTL